ncbi:TetR/AcrR family transcriptional regulator [Bernardetia sp. OM2101]|uniref:TetR/AcrR family transcriptional regulator n=1 Tax=Bernardetia sp. OM2101 TaxID=3344876 RepID=UPI0035CE8C87
MDTRTAILEKNYEAILEKGFQAVRTDKVVADLGITKGAFYHYFPNKNTLGYAVVDEIIYPRFVGVWEESHKKLMTNSDLNAIDLICQTLEKIKSFSTHENIALGCPLNNLIQEMATINETFRTKLEIILDKQHFFIQAILEKGIEKQQIKSEVNPNEWSYFIIAGLEGSYTIGKAKNNLEAFVGSIKSLLMALKQLKKL